MRAVAKRYGMAVMGPNSEGFANTAAALCPTFSPAVEPSDRPLLPSGRERGQLAVIAQSGGIGFSFFDHGGARELAFRYVVTTGNEACLETLDFAEFMPFFLRRFKNLFIVGRLALLFQEIHDAYHFFFGDQRSVDACQARRARRQEQHVAAAEQ